MKTYQKVRLVTKHYAGPCFISEHTYPNGVLALKAVSAITGEPCMTLTCNPSTAPKPKHCWIKSWAENEGLLECLVRGGLVQLTGRVAKTGFILAYEALPLFPEPEAEAREGLAQMGMFCQNKHPHCTTHLTRSPLMHVTFEYHTTCPEDDALPSALWNESISLTVSASVTYERASQDSPGGTFIDLEDASLLEISGGHPMTKDLELALCEAVLQSAYHKEFLEELAAEAYNDGLAEARACRAEYLEDR